MAIVDELVAILGFEMRGEGNLKRFSSGIKQAENNLNAFARSAARMGALAGAAVGAGMASFGKSVLNVSAEFEGYKATLETIEGSADKAQKSFDWITKFATKTPYEVNELTRAFVKLKAYGIEPTDGTMQTLGDSASAMGKTLNDAVEMFADAGTFQFERLKEFGITSSQAGDEVTFSWTKNGENLTKTVKKNSEEIRKFITDNLGSRFNGAMVRQSKTWSGMMSNLSDSWTMFQAKVGDGGFFDAIKGRLSGVLDSIGELEANGTLDRWAKSLSNAMVIVIDEVTRIAGQFKWVIDQIRDSSSELKSVFDAWWPALALIFMRLFPLVAVFALIGLAVDDFITYMRDGESVLGDFIDALAAFLGADPSSVANALGSIASAAGKLAALAVGVGLFASALRAIASITGLMAIAKGVGALAVAMGAASAPFWIAAAPILAVTAGILALGGAIYWLVNNNDFLEWAQNFASGIKETFATVGENLTKPFRDLKDAISRIDWSQMLSGVSDTIDQIVTWFTDLPSRIVGAIRSIDLSGLIEWPSIPAPLRRLFGLGDDTSASATPTATQAPAPSAPNPMNALSSFDDSGRFIGGGSPASQPDPSRFGGGTSPAPANGMADLKARLENMNANIARITPESAVDATITDARVSNDNRQFPMQTSVTVNQTVNGPAQAPDAVARATGNAAAGAANAQRSRITSTPTTSGNGPQ